MCIARNFGRVQAPDCGAPASRFDFSAGLIRLSLLTDMRDQDELNAVQGTNLKGWKPISTTVCVNQLSTPSARIEVEAMAVFPRS